MSKAQDSRKGRRPRGGLFTAVAATVSLMGAAVPIVGAFEHWFDGGTASGSFAGAVDYTRVCNLSNERHSEREVQLDSFKAKFEHAHSLTEARSALLVSTEQDIATRSELESDIEALTPAPPLANVQRSLERDWQANLAALRQFQEHLAARLASAAQLLSVVAAYPRSTLERRSADARGHLLRLGTSTCSLARIHAPSSTDWSPRLRAVLALHKVAHPLRGGSTALVAQGAHAAVVSPTDTEEEVLPAIAEEKVPQAAATILTPAPRPPAPLSSNLKPVQEGEGNGPAMPPGDGTTTTKAP